MTSKLVRPKVTTGITVKVNSGCGNMYITINFNNGKIIEVFATVGKSGGCAYSQLEAITRVITLGFKYDIPINEFIDQLKEISCPSTAADEIGKVSSCADAVAKTLEKYGKDGGLQ